jgi:hypothetical protein
MKPFFQNDPESSSEQDDVTLHFSLGGNSFHQHEFHGNTAWVQGHNHHFEGITETVFAGSLDQHTHIFTVTTTDEKGHVHLARGRTGPPIHLPYGGHIHTLTVDTEFDPEQNHQHTCRGKTRDLIMKSIF